MGDFNKNRSGERRGFGNRGGSDRPQMHQTVCANCGNTCEVPFKPNGSKPVYCKDCFQKMGPETGRSENRRFDRPQFDRPRFENRNENPQRSNDQPNYKAQFEALNTKLDQILTMLSPQAPVEAAPLDSVLNENIIDELVEEVTEEKPKKVKAVKKSGSASGGKKPAKKAAKSKTK